MTVTSTYAGEAEMVEAVRKYLLEADGNLEDFPLRMVAEMAVEAIREIRLKLEQERFDDGLVTGMENEMESTIDAERDRDTCLALLQRVDTYLTYPGPFTEVDLNYLRQDISRALR